MNSCWRSTCASCSEAVRRCNLSVHLKRIYKYNIAELSIHHQSGICLHSCAYVYHSLSHLFPHPSVNPLMQPRKPSTCSSLIGTVIFIEPAAKLCCYLLTSVPPTCINKLPPCPTRQIIYMSTFPVYWFSRTCIQSRGESGAYIWGCFWEKHLTFSRSCSVLTE